MAVLVDGRQYGLSSQGNSTDNKSYLFVKLTDSALKAIEDHVRTGGRSTISFDKNDGKIAFENGSQFQFNISSNPDQGSFECIQQHGSSRLESLGCMGYKMRVQANDDVYETTRQRVANVEEASKKSCTRMIKQSDPFIGRRVKVKAPPGRAVPPPAAARPRHRPDPVGPAQHRSPTRPLQPRPAPPAAQPRPPPPPPGPAATTTAGGSAPGRPASAAAGGSAPGRPATTAGGSAPGRPAAAAADLMRRPLKERLAHLLAIRPLKKIEVMQKLYKDGIREKDKKNVHGLLGSVATIRDNVYHLKRHIWNEVSVDWPFYSEQERREFISHRPENVTPPGSDSSGSSRSPAGKRPSPSSADPLPVGCNPVTLPKKPRVSHYRRPGENAAAERLSTVSATVSAMSQGAAVPAASASASANAIRPRLSASAGGHGVSEPAGERRNTGPQGYEWHKTQSSSQSPSSTGVSDRTPTPDSSPDSHHSSGSSASGSHRADLEHEHDYRSQYVPITCESQLQRYKGDFESGYQEYQQLWELVSSVYRKFAELEQQLHAAEKGSEEWKGIERKIRDEYEACNNEQYRTARRRWFYLQNKLQYVKSLVRRWQAER